MTKRMYLSFLNCPNSPLYWNPEKAELKRSVVKALTMLQKNTCQDSFMFQNEDTSSMANRSPPTGAPKAEAMPAAAPADMKFLLSSEFLNLVKKGRSTPQVLLLTWDNPAPTRLPRWIIGPSGPTG